MNLCIELNALERRYSDSQYYSTYDIAKQARIFLRKYGGRVSVYCSVADRAHTRYGYKNIKIIVEYCCKIYGDNENSRYYYIPLVLSKKINDDNKLQLILDEIKESIEW